MMINTTQRKRWRGRSLNRVVQRELDVLKLFQAQPLAVHRHTEVAQVYSILGASHVFLKHDTTVMHTVVTRWSDLQTVLGFLPHRRNRNKWIPLSYSAHGVLVLWIKVELVSSIAIDRTPVNGFCPFLLYITFEKIFSKKNDISSSVTRVI